MIGKYTAALVLFLMAAFAGGDALALDPMRRISQYGHTAWRLSDDALGGIPTAITQTADGYIWIGTQSGLLRFDGVQFVPWQALSATQPPSVSVSALFGDRSGNLWIGGTNALYRWRDGVWNVAMEGFRTNGMAEDATGAIWFTRSRTQDNKGGVCVIRSDLQRCFGLADGSPLEGATPILRDAQNNIWAGGSRGLVRWDGKAFSSFLPESLRQGDEGLHGALALATLPDGTLLAGMGKAGPGGGVQQIKDDAWNDFKSAGIDISRLAVVQLLVDRDGALWIGTANEGLVHLHGDRSDRYDSGDGLSGNSITSLFEDREGNIWVTTPQGVDRFRDLRVATVGTREGIATDWISSVVAARDGGVWIGAFGALYRIRNGNLTVIDERAGLPGKMVTAMLEDAQGTLWLGVDSDLYRYERGRFHVIKKGDGSPIGAITGLVQDAPDSIVITPTRFGQVTRLKNGSFRDSLPFPDGARFRGVGLLGKSDFLLLLTDGRMVRPRDGGFETLLSGISGIKDGFADAPDSFWLPHRDGLLRWQRGQHRTLDSSAGLPCNRLHSAIRDRNGNVWLYAECGLVRIAERELQRWWNDPSHRPAFELLDSTSGAYPAGNAFSPTAAVDDTGTVWFISELLVQFVEPASRRPNQLPPPVHIERVIADGSTLATGATIAFAPLTRDIQIDYTALSFSVPQKVRFRYRLEGLENEWRDVGNRRQALFSNLAPGDYRFHVLAANNDGVWNTQGASLLFSIPPAYYQTAWFRTVCVLLLAGAIWMLVTMRISAVIRQVRGRLAERLAERERIARDLHDTLLQGFHGLMLRFHVAIKSIPQQDQARVMMEETLDRADALLAEGRERIRDLRYENGTVPPLPEALAAAGEDLRREASIECHVTVEGTAREIDPLIRDEMYLVGREAMTNAFRHSQGTLIEVEIHFDDSGVRLRVRDDGKGIAEETLRTGGLAGHWGLSGMHERALKIGGEVRIWNRPGTGTEVELRVPAAIAYPRSEKLSFWRRLLTH